MKKYLFFLLVMFFSQVAFSQSKVKLHDIMSTKKLAVRYKDLKSNEKDEFFQQYYWLMKMEELKKFPNLSTVKPKVLYEFVKEIYPTLTTKSLEPKYVELRKTAGEALNYFFLHKDLENAQLVPNVESYVDPSNAVYYTGVNPEKVNVLVPKEVYTFTSFNKRSGDEKKYFLWVKDDKYKIVDIVPNATTQTKFYSTLKYFLPNYKFSKMDPKIKKGDKTIKRDADFYFITPFQEDATGIMYKTDDFKDFTLLEYKKESGNWTVIDQKKTGRTLNY